MAKSLMPNSGWGNAHSIIYKKGGRLKHKKFWQIQIAYILLIDSLHMQDIQIYILPTAANRCLGLEILNDKVIRKESDSELIGISKSTDWDQIELNLRYEEETYEN